MSAIHGFAAENRGVLAQYRNIERVKRAEGKVGASIRQIENSDRPGDEKRTMIRTLQDRRNQMARSIVPAD